jgi:hypothetical protein
MTWIQTATREKFDLLHPDPAAVDPQVVAHSLARINRFTGHTHTGHPDGLGYTVAQHCVLASQAIRDLVPADLKGTRYEDTVALEALVHDAAEAYTGDMSAPMKRALRAVTHSPAGWGSDFDRIEFEVWTAVAKAFRVPVHANPLVKLVDLRMLATEARTFMSPTHPDWTSPVEPFAWDIAEVWTPIQAERAWLAMYDRLTGRKWSVTLVAQVQLALRFEGEGGR